LAEYRKRLSHDLPLELVEIRLGARGKGRDPARTIAEEGAAVRAARERDVAAIAEKPEERDPAWTLRRMLSSPTIASKRWVYRQYDTTVRTGTVLGPGDADAAVIRLRGTDRAIAMKTDGNGRYVHLDPRVGGRIAVAEAARNVACAGARPRAITNNHNFGNPRRPDIYFQLREAVAGMGEACRALGTPVTGGNVSLYNENPRGAVYPTPVVGMVGVIESLEHVTRSAFSTVGDRIVLLGSPTAELGGSEYLQRVHGVVAGPPPSCNLDAERALINALLAAIQAGAVRSAHDCADGGLAVALAECAILDRAGQMGATVDLGAWPELPLRALLFGEAAGRVVVSTPDPATVLRLAREHGVPAAEIGTVDGGDALTIRMGARQLAVPLARLDDAYFETIPRIMSRAVGATAEPSTTTAA
jgi:phosphoribosylformylglycinamidine synthase